MNAFVVEATRSGQAFGEVPFALSMIGKERIQRAERQLTLDESLEGVPGVFILNPWNYAQDTRIAIRGFGARADFGIRGIRLVVDGIPGTTPDGQGEVDGLDLGSAGRIEVLRGPGSLFYGPASGGVILVETEDPPSDPFAETRLSGGDFGVRQLQFKAGGQFGTIGYLLSGGYLESDGHRDHNNTENTRFNGKVGWRLTNDQSLRFVFNVIYFPLQNDPGGLTRAEAGLNPRQARARNVLYNSGESVQQQRIGLQYENFLDDHRSLEMAFHYTRRDFANRLPFESGGQVSFLRDFYGMRVQYRHEGDSGDLSIGADLDQQADDRKNFDNLEGLRGDLSLDQAERVGSAGVFAFYAWDIGDELAFSLALRHDRVRFDVDDRHLSDGDDSGVIEFKETTPGLGLSWEPRRNRTFYVNFSQSYETPTTTEFDNPAGGGFNQDLGIQVANNLEFGARGLFVADRFQLTYQLAAFHLSIEDAIVPYELPEFPDREFYRNAGSSTRRGIEFALDLDLRGGLSIGIDYTWSDFEYDRFVSGESDFSGNRIPGIPEHFGGVRLAYEGPSGFFAEWRTRLVGPFHANDANTERINSYAVTSVRFGHRWTGSTWEFEPFLGIGNLFDESYFANIRINAFGGRHFEPAPGRNIYGGLRLRYMF